MGKERTSCIFDGEMAPGKWKNGVLHGVFVFECQQSSKPHESAWINYIYCQAAEKSMEAVINPAPETICNQH